MTAVLPRATGRHRALETDEPRWATAAEFSAAWARAGRHAALEPSGRHAAVEPLDLTAGGFLWLSAPAAR